MTEPLLHVDHLTVAYDRQVVVHDMTMQVSASELDDLIDKIKAQGVKAVFAESALPSKVAKTIANEAGVKVVDGEGALYGDGLGPAKSPGGTYLGMMRHNTTTIVDNLG